MKFYDKYTGILRTFKFLYAFYNFFEYKKLKHNKALYKKFGVRKSFFSTITNADFKNLPGSKPWLDESSAPEKLASNEALKTFPEALQEKIKAWPDKGYMVLEAFFDATKTDAVNAEIEALLQDKKVDFNYTNKKIMFAFHHSKYIRDIVNFPELTRLLNFILGKEVIPFQTINFLRGSEQKAHSDSIHMTTYPLGYLVAVWIALEDTHVNNGPLFYYPGSHKLPYLLNDGFDSGSTKHRIGSTAYKQYEKKLQEIIEEKNLNREDFYAKKGDVFIWHANLIHGGNPVLDKQSTRKSMVIHYFCKDVIAYHELTQRPALFASYPIAEVRAFDED